ncbi:hypothetical protein [Bordetella avium]|uniref:Membrane protein n=1 Tax=Bordetella avium (strain 197N) TaxID=360910 RepID=Q2L0I6_BORA1|nr:hypothetical protein [Bordetella avium]RIQ52811.1 hypothetical protein D0843_08180 [Bordetella avium]RIQ71402.1 hypothetical protein D0838_12080 [Bordetella avium]CAJ49505.1 putative membrane protein [Bordetella avium 197N]
MTNGARLSPGDYPFRLLQLSAIPCFLKQADVPVAPKSFYFAGLSAEQLKQVSGVTGVMCVRGLCVIVVLAIVALAPSDWDVVHLPWLPIACFVICAGGLAFLRGNRVC